MIVLQGMCYSGKTTLGALLARELDIPFLDSRDLFQRKYQMSETEYLTTYGREKFCIAEANTLKQDLGNIVFSLGGSACYYDAVMTNLKSKHTVVWLNVSLSLIKARKEAEGKQRPVVFPEGIDTFDALYHQRKKLYPKFTTMIIVVNETQPPVQTVQSIVDRLSQL